MTKVLSLILGVLFLAGCASSPCKSKDVVSEPVAAAPAVTAVAEPVAAPAQVSEPVADDVPAATKKYVSK